MIRHGAYIPGDGIPPNLLGHGEVGISPGEAAPYRGPVLDVPPALYRLAAMATDEAARASTTTSIAHYEFLLADAMATLGLDTNLRPFN
jgi:hypothetical protein